MGSPVQVGKHHHHIRRHLACGIGPNFLRGEDPRSPSHRPCRHSHHRVILAEFLAWKSPYALTQNLASAVQPGGIRLRIRRVRWCMGLLRWGCLHRWMNHSRHQCRCRIQAPRRPTTGGILCTGPDPLADAVADTFKQSEPISKASSIRPSPSLSSPSPTSPSFPFSCGPIMHLRRLSADVLIGGHVHNPRQLYVGRG